MARFRDRLRVGGRDRNDAVVIDDGPGTEIIVLDAVEEVADAVEPGVLAAAEPLSGRHAARAAARAPGAGRPSTSADHATSAASSSRWRAGASTIMHSWTERAADVVELERRIAELDGRLRRRRPTCAAATSPCRR